MENTNDSKLNSREASPDIPVAHLIDSLRMETDSISILINKSDYTLQLLANNIVIKTYPVVFGADPVNDKQMEGDKRTPEGDFKIRNLYPHAAWSKFLWIDFPNDASWEKFNTAKKNGLIPEEATIGSEIGIHGTPDDACIDRKINWTAGCISLKNKHIDEIYQFVHSGTKVKIIRRAH